MSALESLLLVGASAASFGAVFILWYSLQRKSIRRSDLLIAEPATDREQPLAFEEPVEIAPGWALDGFKAFIWIALVANVAYSGVTVFRIASGSIVGVPVAVISGFTTSTAIALAIILGFRPLSAGKVIADIESLRVPGLFRECVYSRRNTKVWMHKVSRNYYKCVLSDGVHTSHMAVGAKSAKVLRAWSVIPEGINHKRADD